MIRNVLGEMKRTSEWQTQRDKMRKKRKSEICRQGERERDRKTTDKGRQKKEMISEQMTHYQERA